MPDTLNKQEQIALEITKILAAGWFPNGLPDLDEPKKLAVINNIISLYQVVLKRVQERKP
jgi:hypothetical protein